MQKCHQNTLYTILVVGFDMDTVGHEDSAFFIVVVVVKWRVVEMVMSDVVPWCMHDKVTEVGADESQKTTLPLK